VPLELEREVRLIGIAAGIADPCQLLRRLRQRHLGKQRAEAAARG
jgi:hypothetical protein